ncbi:ABC transporter substrate-binding protein [Oceanicoccus sp. KOV_DT_Chl]|uniref:substrate-binding periplasmic protein n=1 Tax=Oceanicoccus sp. KOV_DT_Chl TaxID=1904639 RepID=UPI001356A407|nr:transporter substrate-binding domain-containing protein [Oceanicoccus sp. KOV_DT_Chl]
MIISALRKTLLQWLSVVFCLLASKVAAGTNVQSIVTLPPQSGQETSHHYFTQLLELALLETRAKFGEANIVYSRPYNQAGGMLELMRDGSKLDVLWSGSSASREEHLLAVKIPLMKGLLGYRMPIIRQQDVEKFSAIKSIAQLKKFTACQGRYWPDSDILESNGLTVKRFDENEDMFVALSQGNCDYISLAVFEGQAELDARKIRHTSLIYYQDLIIYYPFPMYFFVQRGQPELHNRIQSGLEKIISSGQLNELMLKHAATNFVFPLDLWINKSTIILKHNSLALDPKELPPKLWILP